MASRFALVRESALFMASRHPEIIPPGGPRVDPSERILSARHVMMVPSQIFERARTTNGDMVEFIFALAGGLLRSNDLKPLQVPLRR